MGGRVQPAISQLRCVDYTMLKMWREAILESEAAASLDAVRCHRCS